jgi:hypothetical protein
VELFAPTGLTLSDNLETSPERQAWKREIDSTRGLSASLLQHLVKRSVNSKWRLVFLLAGFVIVGMARAEDVAEPASGGQPFPNEQMRPGEQANGKGWTTQPVEATGRPAGTERVDLLLTNGNIYTVTEKQPKAEAVAVKGNRIVFVGSNDDAKKFHAAKIVDLRGRTVVPGFTDSHCHIFGIGEREMRLNLEGTNSLGDFLARVKERVDKTGPGKWITGRGWIETFWKPPQFPTRQDLDKIAPDNPLFLTRADGHASVANSAALKIARIDKNTPDPFGRTNFKKERRAKRDAAR